MYAAIRGLIKRWVGMTEVQTAEAAETAPPAVPCPAPATGARRLKRPGSSTAEDAGLKRPRTAPATPIDTGSNGPSTSHAVPELDIVRAQDTGPPDNPARPSAAASAPAALNSGPTFQPAVSTGGTAGQRDEHIQQVNGPSSRPQQRRGTGGGDANSGRPRHRLARSHSEDAAADSPPQPQNQHQPQGVSPLHPGSASRSGASRGGTPHSETHSHPDPHHRHDALEEQVFSPSFHIHAATPGSGSGAATGATAGEHSPASAGPGAAVQRSVSAPVFGGVPVRALHPHGSSCTQLHAIDLNVVEGVAADSEEEEAKQADGAGAGVRAGRGKGGAGPAAEEVGEAVAAQRHEGKEGPGAAEAEAPVSSSSGDDLRAHGERLSSSDEGAGEGEAEGEGDDEAEQAGEQQEEQEEEFSDANDENAPDGGHAAAAARQHQQRPHGQRGQTAAANAAANTAAAAVPRDAVLVASAPRNIGVGAAAVAGAAAASAAQPSGSTESDEGGEGGGEEDELFLEFDPLLFIKQLPPLESCVPPNRPPLLPPLAPRSAPAAGGGGKRKTLVLDLDETLVHSSLEPVSRADFSFPVSFNGAEHTVHVRQRPHLRDFMVRVAALFEVVVFTASQRIYAERLLDILDPGQELVQHRIYRDSCVVVDGNYLKDLSVLGRELAHTIIVDNSPQAFGFQVDNGIPIESWYDDDSDDELLRLLPFLESLAGHRVDDVRPLIRQQFRLQELIDRA